MRWWGWVIVILVVLWAIHHSTQAAGDVHGISNFISDTVG